MAFFGYNERNFKAQLKMAKQRIKLVNNKIENEVKRLKREIERLLNKPDKEEEKAMILCEHLIRGDHTIAAHSILELMIESLIARVKVISSTKSPPHDLLQAITSVIYCSTRVDIPELKKITKSLAAKYSRVKNFVKRARDNLDSTVNEKILNKLNIGRPKESLVREYLKRLAKEYGFQWTPRWEIDGIHYAQPTGGDVNPAAATGFTHVYGADGAPILDDDFAGCLLYTSPSPRDRG